MFKEAIRRLARINESGMGLTQDTCKKRQIDRGKNTCKRLQHEGAFKI